jgi:hypothetical protein
MFTGPQAFFLQEQVDQIERYLEKIESSPDRNQAIDVLIARLEGMRAEENDA